MFRAKFRVLSHTASWNDQLVVDLKPVYPDSKTMEWAKTEDKCQENKMFWDATPSGEASLGFSRFDS